MMQIRRLGVNSFVQTIRGAFVQQIEPAGDALSTELGFTARLKATVQPREALDPSLYEDKNAS
jgi:hypothetical protein